jgi:hypothetical protein
MNKLSLAACTGLLLVLPATAHAQADAHPQVADQAEHDHSAPPPGDAQPDAAPPAERRMEMGEHMKDCCCPCCEMMRQHGALARPDDSEAPAAVPEQHQH